MRIATALLPLLVVGTTIALDHAGGLLQFGGNGAGATPTFGAPGFRGPRPAEPGSGAPPGATP